MLYIVIERTETFKSYLGRVWDHSRDRKHDQIRTDGIPEAGHVYITSRFQRFGDKTKYTELYVDKRHKDRG